MKRILLTYRQSCNMQCKFCYLTFFNSKVADRSLEIVEKAKQLGFDIITFTGGDPFSKRSFRAACELSKSLGFITHVDTNGLAVKDSEMEFINANIDMLGISIDGVGIKHNSLRESQTSFEKIESILFQVRELNACIKVNTVLTKINIAGVNELGEFISKFPWIVRWSIYQFFPLDAAANYAVEYSITTEEFEAATNNLKAHDNCRIERFLFKDRVEGYLFVDETGELFTNNINGNYEPLGSIFNQADLSFFKDKDTFINPKVSSRYNLNKASNETEKG